MVRGLPVTDPLERRLSCTCKRVLQKHPLRTARIRSCRTRTVVVHMFRFTYAGAFLSGCGVRPVSSVPGRVHDLQVFLQGLMVIPVVTADFLDFPVRCTVPDVDGRIMVRVIPVASRYTGKSSRPGYPGPDWSRPGRAGWYNPAPLPGRHTLSHSALP